MNVFIDKSRVIEGVSLEDKIAGISLETRMFRAIQKAGDQIVATQEEAQMTLDWATVYSFTSPMVEKFRIDEPADLEEIEDQLWEGCRKDVDGVISRNHNRHISLFISRRIARFRISPNYISIFTFILGVLSGVFASFGDFTSVFIAGCMFQSASVIDGVDGELARVKLEFSVLGEWLDTISDDSSDVFFYAGLGIGALNAGFEVGPITSSIFMTFAAVAVFGKLLSMFLYYRVLIRKKRGDLYAFDWDEESDGPVKGFSAVLSNLRYVTKNDFIAFSALVLAALGVAPLLVLAAAPGTLIVSFSVARQIRKNRKVRGNNL